MIVNLFSSQTPHRMRVWAVTNGQARAAAPSAGSDVDLITGGTGNASNAAIMQGGTDLARLAVPGTVVQIESGAAFNANAELETDDQGRAITRTTGVAVLRALQAATGAGQVVSAVVRSGR
jgi:hypothetical protein